MTNPSTVPGVTAHESAPVAEAIRIPTPVGAFDALATGPEDGRNVLLLHGFPQSSAEWEHQLGALAKAGYRAVAPDQRGYSPGVRPPEVSQYGLDELVGDVLRIADALGWSQFDLIGHDWGAAISWILADRHPDRLRTLTAVSVPHPRPFADALRDDEDQQRRSAYLAMFRQAEGVERQLLSNDAAVLRQMLREACAPAKVDHYVARLREPGALNAALNWYRATSPQEVLSGQITVPTLYVWGSADLGVGPTAARGTGAWVSAPYRFEVFPDISHWVPEQAAARLTAVLLAHLDRHGD